MIARLVTVLVVLLSIAATTHAAERPPNVVVVLMDNFGQEWISCYGSESVKTPNLDKLAAEGVRVEHCYTPPVCGPSRIVLLTGRYPFRTGYTLHHDAGLYGGGGLDPVRDLIFPNVFHSAGYATGIFGKWQINDLYAEPDALKRHGFDTHVVWPDALDSKNMDETKWAAWKKAIAEHDVATTQTMLPLSESRYWDPVVLRDGKREVLTGRYGPDVFQESAFAFLSQNKDKPFLLYCPMVLTHGQSLNEPVVPTPDNRDKNRPMLEVYADMVRYADKLVGGLVAELERLGLRENTLLVVATDNGSEHRLTARKNGRDVQGGLYTMKEAGIDTALIFNCPAIIPGGRTVPLADFTDVFPTVCEFAGVPLPAGRVFDGKSLAPFLRGTVAKPPRDTIFCQYHKTRVIRDERFKLYSTGELYDVAADPDETKPWRAENAPTTAVNFAAPPPLLTTGNPAADAAREKLRNLLHTLPPDAPPPFKLRSQSAFKLESEGKL